ncbi:MerR family DNA-binding transcriptional regulator [Nocardioides convexus]|uniref:MerR family DNA-binding transcriptional regulator n=1 Tax=Nocardioides convexus TaxID=2712224 RepID=UPI00241848A3|nr:MerR family DNA-binding transcriptional regulator [Nocardioides convexus]
MRTSELAERVGVNAETLRYYERRGLLAPPPRTPGGYRDFPATAVESAAVHQAGTGAGLHPGRGRRTAPPRCRRPRGV